jgi:hypothetical protein
VAGLGVSAALLRPLLAGGGCCLLARKGLEARVGAAEGAGGSLGLGRVETREEPSMPWTLDWWTLMPWVPLQAV